MVNRRIVLASRPAGEPGPANFRMEETPLPVAGDGEVLLRTLYLSLDPYMRGRMSDAPSYAPPAEIGDVMPGSTVSTVVDSKTEAFRPGDTVLAYTGWQEYATAKARYLRKLDAAAGPVSAALGVLGMPGFTAYAGLKNIGQPKAGETVVVAAAAGAVGSVVGQIARLQGCRAVGIAGGPEKCKFVTEELGFDACVDHRSASFATELKAACPKGIDVYFENVGGAVLRAVLPLLNPFARVPVCGLIAQYSATGLPEGPDHLPLLMGQTLVKRITWRGFIVTDFGAQQPEFDREMGAWVRDGKIRYREDITEGLEHAVDAFLGMLRGRNLGKTLVKMGG